MGIVPAVFDGGGITSLLESKSDVCFENVTTFCVEIYDKTLDSSNKLYLYERTAQIKR